MAVYASRIANTKRALRLIKPLVDKNTPVFKGESTTSSTTTVSAVAGTETPVAVGATDQNNDASNQSPTETSLNVKAAQQSADDISAVLEKLLIIKGIIDKNSFVDVNTDSLPQQLTLEQSEQEEITVHLKEVFKILWPTSSPEAIDTTNLSFYSNLNKHLILLAGQVKALLDKVTPIWTPFESQAIELASQDAGIMIDTGIIRKNLQNLQTISSLVTGIDLYAIETKRLTNELRDAQEIEKDLRPWFFRNKEHDQAKAKVTKLKQALQYNMRRQASGPWTETLDQLRSQLKIAEANPLNQKPWFPRVRKQAKKAYDDYQTDTINVLKAKIKLIQSQAQENSSNILSFCRYLPVAVLEAVKVVVAGVPIDSHIESSGQVGEKRESLSAKVDDEYRSRSAVASDQRDSVTAITSVMAAPEPTQVVISTPKKWLENKNHDEEQLAIRFAEDLSGKLRLNLINKPLVENESENGLSFIQRFALILKYRDATIIHLETWVENIANDLIFTYTNNALSARGNLASPSKKPAVVGFAWVKKFKDSFKENNIDEINSAANNLNAGQPSTLLKTLFDEEHQSVNESLINLSRRGEYLANDKATDDDRRLTAGNFLLDVLNVLFHGTEQERSLMTTYVNHLIAEYQGRASLYSPELGKILAGLSGQPIDIVVPTRPKRAASPTSEALVRTTLNFDELGHAPAAAGLNGETPA